MLHPTQNIRYGQRTQNFNATTSLFNYGTLGAAYNSNLPCTWLALIRPTGAGEGNFGYFASKCITSSATGMRWLVTHNGGSPYLFWGITSGNTGPGQSAPAGSITYGKWIWVAATYAGGLAASSIRLYQGADHLREVSSYPLPVTGTGSINNDSSNNFVIGNRDGGDRTFAGDIAMVVRWDSVLDLTQINDAAKYGPLSVRADELMFCWAGGQEVSKHKFTPTTITARALGRPRKYPIIRYAAPLWLTSPAAGAFFLNAEPASYTVTGADAGLIAGRVLDAQPATYSVTGFDAGLFAGRGINAEPASYAVTGFDAGLLANRVLNAEPASYTFTAFDADLVYTVSGTFFINAEPASYAVTAADAGLISARLLNAEAASYTVTANDAGVLVGRGINAEPASYVVTGFDADLVVPFTGMYFLNAEPATYTITAFDAGLTTTAETDSVTGGWPTVEEYQRHRKRTKREPKVEARKEIDAPQQDFSVIPQERKAELKGFVEKLSESLTGVSIPRQTKLALKRVHTDLDYGIVPAELPVYEGFITETLKKREEEKIVVQIIIQLMS